MRLIDLSQPVFHGSPNCPAHPPVRSEIFKDHPTSGWRVELLTIASHTGSHVDAPLHKIAGGASLDDIPLPEALIPGRPYDTKDQESALERIGRSLNEHERDDRPVNRLVRPVMQNDDGLCAPRVGVRPSRDALRLRATFLTLAGTPLDRDLDESEDRDRDRRKSHDQLPGRQAAGDVNVDVSQD